MKKSRRQFISGAVFSPFLPLTSEKASASALPSADSKAGILTEIYQGRVVCFTEEFARRHGIAPECEQSRIVWGLLTDQKALYAFLPTDSAAAIYEDKRMRERLLRVTVRIFPGTSWIEVIKLQSVRASRIYDLYYFCDVCNIRSHKPGLCECCQDPVLFHEEPAESGSQD